MASPAGPTQRPGKRDAENQVADAYDDKHNKPPPAKSGVTIPRWLLILLAVGCIVSMGLALMSNIGVLIIAVDGKRLGSHVDSVMSIADMLGSQFPSIVSYLGIFANATASASSASVEEIVSGGPALPAVPPVLYANLTTYSVRMAYRKVGQCSDPNIPVVLFVHDLTGSSLQWLEEMTLLASSNLCAIAIDMLGHGNSDSAQLVSGGSVTSQTAYLHAFLTVTGLISDYARELSLCGSGFGAMVTSSYVFTHDGAIDNLILFNPMPYAVHPDDPNGTLSNVTGAVSADFLSGIAAFELTDPATLAMQFASSITLNSVCTTTALSSLTDAYASVFLQAEPLAVVQGFLSMRTIDLRASFAGLITPTLLIVGGNFPSDATGFNYAYLAQTTRNLIGASATLHIIGSSSAAPQLTHTGLVHEYVLEFLEGTTSLCDAAPIQFSLVS